MPARLDKPLRLIGCSHNTARALRGGLSLQSLLMMSRAFDEPRLREAMPDQSTGTA
jgi:hypothetical protein